MIITKFVLLFLDFQHANHFINDDINIPPIQLSNNVVNISDINNDKGNIN